MSTEQMGVAERIAKRANLPFWTGFEKRMIPARRQRFHR